ncbi:MAG: hypothetical protein QXS91_03395 [Candidatus Anstonellales archaeon]
MPKAEQSMGATMKSLAPKLFIAGFVLAIIIGAWAGSTGQQIPGLYYLLLVLGVVVGWFNVTDKEALLYLVSVLALLSGVSFLNNLFEALPDVGKTLASMLSYLTVFLASGAALVALRNLYELTKD